MDFATILIIVFVIGYLAIVLEHSIKINKTASAILTGVLCWTLFILLGEGNYASGQHGAENPGHHAEIVNGMLAHHLADISQILFFLLGAMTIVELVDAHHGFKVITDRIKTKKHSSLIWIISLVTFFLSAALDNLTTAIVMVSLLRKLIVDKQQRMMYASLVIIAANAGGAWSPIGDVTTTMLWIGGQITAVKIMTSLFLPSLISLLIPTLYLSFFLKGSVESPVVKEEGSFSSVFSQRTMLFFGLGALLFVPIFKTVTHLPPYMGILLGLGVVWIVSEMINSNKDEEEKTVLSVAHALSKIDASSILFFLGILVAVGCLQATGFLGNFALWMDKSIGNIDVIVIAIGLASAVIDNVPLVAATMGMYSLDTYPADHHIWEFIAYCAGTGGSILIIGSAAGVAVMGMEKIEFFWYMKRVSLMALLGYFAGAFTYLLLG
jgi:NhaD family Na+/H+ antiporter